MPARKLQAPRPRDILAPFEAHTDSGKERLLSELARLSSAAPARSSVVASLVVGDNRIVHQLGRVPVGCTVTPRVADASFAWALKSADDRVAVVTVVGVAQPNAEVEFH